MNEVLTMLPKMYSVVGLGNPLLDFLAPVDPSILELLSAKKGTMNLVDREGMEGVLSKLAGYTNIPGGSAANTLRAISSSSSRSFTRKTVPMPPLPSVAMIS